MSSADAPITLHHRGTRSEVFAWAMYDWANSAWSTILITVVVFYLTTVVVPSDWGPFLYGNGVGVSMFVAALLSPVLGALADQRATKRFWLAVTALGGAGAGILMGIVPAQPAWMALALFFIANLGFELSYGICNGFLPEISDDSTVNRVSAWGFGAGYVGGGLALALALLVMLKGSWFGLPDGTYLTCDYNLSDDAAFVVDLPDDTYRFQVWTGSPGLYSIVEGEVENLKGEGLAANANARIQSDSLRWKIQNGKFIVEFFQGRELNGSLSEHYHPVPIQGFELIGKNHPFEARFDFGTTGSPVEPGFIQVTPNDRYQEYDLVQAKGLKPDQFKLGDSASTKLRFGWTRGDVTAVDAVNPLRMRIALVIGGIWWALFSLPAILVLRDKVQPRAQRQSVIASARDAFAQVGTTLKHVRLYPTLAIFLIGFLLYNDGMQTVISQASVFAKEALFMTTVDLIPLILVIQFVSLPGALFVGWLSDRIGQKKTLLATLAVWIGLLFAAFFVTTKGQFWVMGIVLALVMGGAQSVSRAIMGRMTPATRAAEFMGFFNFSGKATSIFGPMLFATTLKVTHSAHLAILSLLIFFVLGTLLVVRIDVAEGQREALAEA